MTMDPQVKAVLAKLKEMGAKPPRMISVADARKGLDAFMEYVRATGGVEDVARIEDRKVPGPAGDIPVRIFVPMGGEPVGAMMYFHGGGWVIGGLFSHDNVCRSFANAAGCIVIAVDYRLSPENKFPAAPEDCYAATRWAAENAASIGYPAGKLAVGGDSAGGNLSTVVCLMARDRGGPKIAYQLLIYPVTDAATDTSSYKDFWGDGYFLSGADMAWFWSNYLARKEDGDSPYASPARAKSLAGLPPAMVITAGLDPLRDEGEAYAIRLIEAGVPTLCVRYEYVTHAMFNMAPIVDAGKTMTRQAAAAVREALTK
jgi:acetyl esterase